MSLHREDAGSRVARFAWRESPPDWAWARSRSALALLAVLVELGAGDDGRWVDALLADQTELAGALLGVERVKSRPLESRGAVIGRARDLERLGLIVSRGTRRRGERAYAPTLALEALQAGEVAA